jgi:hypothetical protein
MKRRINLFFIVVLFVAPFSSGAVTIELVATVPGCGDGIVESGEQCDISDFGGSSCSSLGFAGGTLSCTLSCTINTSACTSGVFGGGGGGAIISSTRVVFVGKSSPGSTITLLKDAQIVLQTVAGVDGSFQVSISGVYGGNYVFSVYSDDTQNVRSSSLTFPIYVTSGAITKVSDIFIAPTIAIDKIEAKRGDPVIVFGQSAPLSEITLAVSGSKEFFTKKTIEKRADINGTYSFILDTSSLGVGRYQVKSKAALGGAISPFGTVAEFLIGAKNVPSSPSKNRPRKGDLNNDNRVSLTDFSIAAYWYKRPFTDTFKRIEMERLNRDGKITLVDFSIMAFYWTG